MSISSTISTLEVGDYVKQQYLDSTPKYGNNSKITTETIPTIQFEESDGIYVGNIIYNIHHHPKTAGI